METSENTDFAGEIFKEYKLSWVAYVRPLIVFLILCGLSVLLAAVNEWLCVVGVVVSFLLFVYQVLLLRTVSIYTNANGVWMFRGLFPWSKGITGVKWRDLEEASFFMGFVSWACNSYSIRVGHRFTKTSEMFIANVRDGKDAVEHINSTHMQMISGADV